MRLEPLQGVLAELAESLIAQAGDASGCLAVSRAELAIPLEVRFGGDGRLAASLPRWRLATGFEPVLHRLRVSVGEVAAEGG